ncbi:glycerate kinase [Paraoerskovia marina]|uniref:glycerate kinase n=1 Tax=Paraoerskovia marina TaxID=545619 RepID=UPI00138DFEE0|nr:glycerate kinase [Paraoerskovia marina]
MDALVIAAARTPLVAAVLDTWARSAPQSPDLVEVGDAGATGLAVVPGERIPVVLTGPADAAGGARAVGGPATVVRSAAGAWVAAAEIDPLPGAGSWDVGGLVLAAADHADTVFLLAGDAEVPDGGEGLLRSVAGSSDLAEPTPDTVRRARARLAGTTLVCLSDDDLPLLGLNGVSALRGGDAGQEREAALSAYAYDVARAVEADRPGLMAGAGERETFRVLTAAGAGAGGGLGFAVRALGGRVESAAAVLGDVVGLGSAIERHDVAVLVVERLDGSGLHTGVVPDTVSRAADVGVPVVVLAEDVRVGRRELSAAGVAAAYPLGADPASATARVVRTWTRR